MDQSANRRPSIMGCVMILAVVLLAFGLGVTTERILLFFGMVSSPDVVKRELLRGAAPVELSIRYCPKVKPTYPHPSNTRRTCDGPITYLFFNRSRDSIKVSFPPTRKFRFDADRAYATNESIPFPKRSHVVELKPEEWVKFEDKYQTDLVGESHPFLKGGVGPFAFVFSRPINAASDDGYLVGTVFGTYSVEVQAESK